jgi:hypothetical protein
VIASHTDLGTRYLYCERPSEVLFTENETNTARLFGTPNATMWTKDAFHEYVVHGRRDAVNPGRRGTKAAALYAPTVAARGRVEIRLRLTPEAPSGMRRAPFGADFDVLVDTRRREADDFYMSLTPPAVGEDAAGVMRQALAGMLWSKQYYEYDVARWLEEHGVDPRIARDTSLRNAAWSHMQNADIISMPDKWEYPWVRRLGPGFPHDRVEHGRSGFRQGAVVARPRAALPASQRADARLRAELRRRQLTRARVGRLVHLQPRQDPARRR